MYIGVVIYWLDNNLLAFAVFSQVTNAMVNSYQAYLIKGFYQILDHM